MNQEQSRQLILVRVTEQNAHNPQLRHPELIFLRVRDPVSQELLFLGLEEADGETFYLAFENQDFQFRIVVFVDNWEIITDLLTFKGESYTLLFVTDKNCNFYLKILLNWGFNCADFTA